MKRKKRFEDGKIVVGGRVDADLKKFIFKCQTWHNLRIHHMRATWTTKQDNRVRERRWCPVNMVRSWFTVFLYYDFWWSLPAFLPESVKMRPAGLACNPWYAVRSTTGDKSSPGQKGDCVVGPTICQIRDGAVVVGRQREDLDACTSATTAHQDLRWGRTFNAKMSMIFTYSWWNCRPCKIPASHYGTLASHKDESHHVARTFDTGWKGWVITLASNDEVSIGGASTGLCQQSGSVSIDDGHTVSAWPAIELNVECSEVQRHAWSFLHFDDVGLCNVVWIVVREFGWL